MSEFNSRTILTREFLAKTQVKDVASGYIVGEPFNLAIDPFLLALVSQCWADHYAEEPRIDAIVGLPDSGLRLVSILAGMLNIGKILPSKRTTNPPSSWRSVVQYQNDSFTTEEKNVVSQIGFVEPWMRVLVVDDVVAHGSTALAALQALQEFGVEVVGLAVIFDKMWQQGVEKIVRETQVPVFSLIRIKEITPEGEIILDE